MGGDLKVDSTPDQGSEFHFTAWFGRAGSEITDADVPDTPTDSPLPAARILVAEDHAVNRQVAVRMLEKLGLAVDTVSDGQEALEVFAKGRYDLILMDCQMPRLDGYQASRAIRELEANQGTKERVPIVAMTAHAMAGDENDCLEAGMDGHLSKPVTLATLEATLRRHLAKEWRVAL